MKSSKASTHRRHVAIISVVLFSILVAQQLGLVCAGTLQVHRQRTKGLLIDVNLLGRADIPSFSDLVQAQFTFVGTQVTSSHPDQDWGKITDFIKSAHAAGLRTFVFIGAGGKIQVPDLATAAAWTKKAASLGADIVDLDELVVTFNATQAAMQSIIEAGLAVNPSLQFIITEYTGFAAIYSWVSKYPSVRVGNDAYNDKTRIDRNIQFGLQYGKRAYTNLIFSGGHVDFDCYLHLDDWITYVKQRDTDVIFYWINANPWQVQWPKVVSF